MIEDNSKIVLENSGKPKLVCRDNLVSGEKFEILEYEKGILKTEPIPKELSKYYESEAYISHTDSSKKIADKIYQLVKSHMLSIKAKWIREEIKQGALLDYGAGTGDFLNKMKSFLWKVEGVEPNSTARELAILKKLDLAKDLSGIRTKKFDVISLWHVLEHIPDFERKLEQFQQLLKEDGILVIAVPNYNSYDAQYYKEDWAAWDVPRHLWHFSRQGLKSKMQEFGFSIIKEKPLKFDSFYVSLLSEKNKLAGGNLLNAFYRGLISNLKASGTKEFSSITYFLKKSPKDVF